MVLAREGGIYSKIEIQRCIAHQLRKITKSKSVFLNDVLVYENALFDDHGRGEEWRMRQKNWGPF